MTARFDRAWAKASRASLAVSVGWLLTVGVAIHGGGQGGR